MSSTTSSSSFNFSFILDAALEQYTKVTKIELDKNSFAEQIDLANSPDSIFELLQEREKSFKEYREGNRGLIRCIRPAVKALHASSRILGELVHFSRAAKAVIAGIDVLLTAVNEVTSSYDALLELFERLMGFLDRLDIYVTLPPSPIMADINVDIMVELLSVLALATKQIKRGRFKKFTKKFLGEREIEVALHKLDRLTQGEAQIAVTQTLGMVHGLERSTIYGWLSPPDPSVNHDVVLKARHIVTATWFFESSAFAKWKANGSLLWIHGKPGAGKSTLLSAIIQDVERMQAAGLAMMAYYYFDFRDVKKQDCHGLLSSLILQLSKMSDSCYNFLSQIYSDKNHQKPTISVLKKCMEDMLILSRKAPIYIMVDGLDECPNFPGRPSAREEVLELVEKLVNLKLPHVHLCVASRLEMDILSVLEPLTSLRISIHDESGQKKDIIEYIKSFIRSDRSMRRWKEEDKQLVADTLSDKSDGMFRWVVCQFDRLCRTLPASIRNVLSDLPNTLDETYHRTLLGIDEEKREYAQRLFQCLIVSIRPLRVEELAEILAVQYDEAGPPTFNAAWRLENAEEAVMSVCSSLIAIVDREGSRVVQFSHYSAKEFLTSDRLLMEEKRLSCYHIPPELERAHTILALASLSVLLQLDDKIDRTSIADFPLAPYAAQHWIDHARFRSVSSHIQEVMERLFDPGKPHFAAWVWLYDVDRHWLKPMSEMHPTRPKAKPLYYAALCGLHGLVKHLIAAHSQDTNCRGGSHTTPIHAASAKGHSDVASLLLRNGADPNSKDHLGRTPLHRVSQGGHVMTTSLLELLVDSGADLNLTDSNGWTPLHAAARSGYRDIAELLLQFGANLEIRNTNRETPLHVACRDGMLDISRFFIAKGLDANSTDRKGFIPLHWASQYGHGDIARLLLDSGSLVEKREQQRWTPLHYASKYGRLDIVRLLIRHGADVNACIENGSTPMHLASANGHLDIAKLLVDHRAKVDSRTDKMETPLALTLKNSKEGYLDIARFLIESGADVSAKDKRGWTPFHTASNSGRLDIAKFLLECGIDVNIRNGDDETSLDLASRTGNPDFVRLLIENDADIHVKGNKGRVSLHVASKNGKLDVVKLLINSGASVDIRNDAQMTPLLFAASKGKADVGCFLIERGADVNARNSKERTPLCTNLIIYKNKRVVVYITEVYIYSTIRHVTGDRQHSSSADTWA